MFLAFLRAVGLYLHLNKGLKVLNIKGMGVLAEAHRLPATSFKEDLAHHLVTCLGLQR